MTWPILGTLLILSFALPSNITATLVTIDVNGQECFHEHLAEHDKLALTFDVVDGGFNDIDFNLFGIDQKLAYDKRAASSDRIIYAAPKTGVYRFCFANRHTTKTNKLVKMSMAVEHPADSRKISLIESIENDTEFDMNLTSGGTMDRLFDALSKRLVGVKYESELLNWSMSDHIRLARKTNNLLFWWAVFENIFVVIAVAWQIKYILKLFEVVRFL